MNDNIQPWWFRLRSRTGYHALPELHLPGAPDTSSTSHADCTLFYLSNTPNHVTLYSRSRRLRFPFCNPFEDRLGDLELILHAVFECCEPKLQSAEQDFGFSARWNMKIASSFVYST